MTNYASQPPTSHVNHLESLACLLEKLAEYSEEAGAVLRRGDSERAMTIDPALDAGRARS